MTCLTSLKPDFIFHRAPKYSMILNLSVEELILNQGWKLALVIKKHL